jgi:hypothetical protein
MSSQNCGLSARSLAELALIISRVARSVLDESAAPSPESLRLFWQSSRSLQQRWTKALDGWTADGALDVAFLERLAPRVFACEMAVRTWCTVLAALDRKQCRGDFTRLAHNVVGGLLQIRHGVLSRMLLIPVSEQDRVQGIDRMRRRCDRWTDLLTGPVAVRYDCFDFTFDRDRAQDFGEEGLVADPATGPHAIEHLVSAGLRLTFLQHLPVDPVEEPEFVGLTQSILANVPGQAFHRDGSLRTLLEQRIAVSHQRLESRAMVAIANPDGGNSTTASLTAGSYFSQFNRRVE